MSAPEDTRFCNLCARRCPALAYKTSAYLTLWHKIADDVVAGAPTFCEKLTLLPY